MPQVTLTFFAVLDAAGNYAVGETREEAFARYDEAIGALSESGGFTLTEIAVRAPLPRVRSLRLHATA